LSSVFCDSCKDYRKKFLQCLKKIILKRNFLLYGILFDFSPKQQKQTACAPPIFFGNRKRLFL